MTIPCPQIIDLGIFSANYSTYVTENCRRETGEKNPVKQSSVQYQIKSKVCSDHKEVKKGTLLSFILCHFRKGFLLISNPEIL